MKQLLIVMKKCMDKLFFLFVFNISLVFAQEYKGKEFPLVTGETFDGKSLAIPTTTNGKASVIGICFSKDAEKELKAWLNPVYNLFIVKKDENDFFSAAANYDVSFYFIPMLNKVNQILEKSSKDKIRKETDKEFWPYLVFYEGETKLFKETFKLKDNDIPYFFVLDKDGKVINLISGKYSEQKLESLEESMDIE